MATVAFQHMPHITANRALIDMQDKETRKDVADASLAHALSYKSATKLVI